MADDRWDSSTTTLRRGETLVSASDGLLDCYGTMKDMFTAVQHAASRTGSAGEMVDEIVAAANERVVTDDVTVVAVRRTA